MKILYSKLFVITLFALPLLVTGQYSVNIDDLSFERDYEERVPGTKLFWAETSFGIMTDNLNKASLDCGAGNIHIIGTKDKECRIEAKIYTAGRSEEKAVAYVRDYLVLELYESNGGFNLESNFDLADQRKIPFRKSFAAVDLTIYLPYNLKATLNDDAGNILIEGCINDFKINDHSGDIVIDQHQGDLDINDNSGDLKLMNCKSNGTKEFKIVDQSGELFLKEVEANINLTDHSGGIIMEDIYGSVTIKDYSGDIHSFNITGNVYIDDTSGYIGVKKVGGEIEISDSSGDIGVEDVSKDFVVKNDGSGEINYHNIKGSVHISK